MNMSGLPLASVERIMRKAGAKRVSLNAVVTLAEVLSWRSTKQNSPRKRWS
jgi:histone H3/H4